MLSPDEPVALGTSGARVYVDGCGAALRCGRAATEPGWARAGCTAKRTARPQSCFACRASLQVDRRWGRKRLRLGVPENAAVSQALTGPVLSMIYGP